MVLSARWRPALGYAAELMVFCAGSMSGDRHRDENIYENVGGDNSMADDDNGWSSSEFEEEYDNYDYCGDDDNDERGSIGGQSQTSQGSSGVERVVNRTKDLFRRKIPAAAARISWPKTTAVTDGQSVVRFIAFSI